MSMLLAPGKAAVKAVDGEKEPAEASVEDAGDDAAATG
jgi:hypothetical protein